MSNLHFISVPCHQSTRQQGFQFAPEEIKEKYDQHFTTDDFNGTTINENNIKICDGYNKLYDYITNCQNKDIIISIGGDNSISSATVSAMNNKYDNLKVLWIDCYADLENFNTTDDLPNMAMASLMHLCEPTFVTKQKNILKPSQIIYFGISENCDDVEKINIYDIPFFTVNKINTLGINHLIEPIKSIIGNNPLHVVIDTKVIDKEYAPSTIRNDNYKGLNPIDITKLLIELKMNIVAMDITEFNPTINMNKYDAKITKETLRNILIKTFNIKEKSLNVFTEDTKFLIYRPFEQENPYVDYGWYILRGLSVRDKLKYISLIKDNISTITIENEEYLLAKTTINEQNDKSYFGTNDINDMVLFPDEKMDMLFELIN